MEKSPHSPGRAKRFLWYHLPVIVYAGLIITVSSVPNLQTPDLRFLAFDKVAHFLEYAVFALLAFRSFYHLGSSPKLRRSLLLSALFVSFFALLDEMYQHFIPGRYSDWRDFVFDLTGAALVLIVLGVYRRKKQRQSYL